jgi:hypothetical protein
MGLRGIIEYYIEVAHARSVAYEIDMLLFIFIGEKETVVQSIKCARASNMGFNALHNPILVVASFLLHVKWG